MLRRAPNTVDSRFKQSHTPVSVVYTLRFLTASALLQNLCCCLQSLCCCLPDLSHHLSQLLRNCVPCAACTQRSACVKARPTGFLPWLQVSLQSLCALVQLFCDYCFLTPCMAVLCSRMLAYALSCCRCLCKSASDHLLTQFSKSLSVVTFDYRIHDQHDYFIQSLAGRGLCSTRYL